MGNIFYSETRIMYGCEKMITFINLLHLLLLCLQETDGVREGEKDKIAELQKMVDTIKDRHIKQLVQEVKEWTNKLLSKVNLQAL